MLNPFVGQILLFPFNFPPVGFAFCAGQLLPISQNTALFSLLGTIYGGDGKSTFALPDLAGRAPLGFGQGPGLANYDQGESAGDDIITLALTQIPVHTHTIDIGPLAPTARCRNGSGNQQTPVGNVPAIEAAGGSATYSNLVPNANMHPGAVAVGGGMPTTNIGGGQPHTNMQPYLKMNFCIALQGVFPPRT